MVSAKGNKADNQLKKVISKIDYERGIWTKSLFKDQGGLQLKQKAIYDKNGLPLYLIKYRGNELDNEYVLIND